MSTKPILFSTPMVQAILNGRKTMTRRVIKPQPTYWDDVERLYDKDSIVGPEFYNPTRVGKNGEEYPGDEVYGIYSDNGEYGCKAPYKPGDVLWVREAWCPCATINGWLDAVSLYGYKADYDRVVPWKWKPSIHMPREAARLFLRVKDVRVERVQDISAEDCEAEGYFETAPVEPRPRSWFSSIWDSLNANGWDKNPWVWVYSFERVDKPAGWPGGEVEG